MGLDQFAYVRFPDLIDDEGDVEPQHLRIATWRKHPNLQGWMERLWRQRNKTMDAYEADTLIDDEFNCIELELTLDDIDALEQDVMTGNLNGGHGDTTGFFFGDNRDQEYKWEDLTFCTHARMALKNGLTVCYNSWW